MKRIMIFFLLIVAINSNAQTKDETAIVNMLKKQEAAWNNGNLNKFMIGYWENDSLMFIGKKGLTYGYDATLNNYKKSYPDTSYMGKFTSTIISLKKLSKSYYFVVGKWFLQRSVGNIEGHYTLLIKKIKKQWVIVADHSS
ncbi:MAG: DUF4440 domain-containing protein [Chitinophagaceae bacterium]|nr:DUF4440 domain-containing protein [Chitinophagaceae bacterium]MCW5906111.1 DUF4440 domain-containing protein [Chitinophagaceae bacterium]